MESKKQIEIQFGHMCNNRCVFCCSGQATAMGRAEPLDKDPMLESVRQARAMGHTKLTFVGGEPTLQPSFMRVLQETVSLGFEEIVIFTNGVKTARGEFIDEILTIGGNITWRLSFQGANQAAHDDTTKKPGSFTRLLRTLEGLRAREQRITVNMCLVSSNYASVPEFAALLLPYGVTQLHVDMVRPLETGDRTEEELRAMIPYYPDIAPALVQMVSGFPEDFDVNVGNFPFCLAPDIASKIHYDGEQTQIISIEKGQKLSDPWSKYLTKRRDKVKPASCKQCVFDARCRGVYVTYANFYGTDHLVPVTAAMLRKADPKRKLFALHVKPLLEPLFTWEPPAPFHRVSILELNDRELSVTLESPEGRLTVSLSEPGGGLASFEHYALYLHERPASDALTRLGLSSLWEKLCERGGAVLHPPGDDAFCRVSRSVGLRIGQIRRAAPFGTLSLHALRISNGGLLAEAELHGPAGERAVLWLGEKAGKPLGGYRLADGATPTPALVEGLRAVMAALQVSPPQTAS